MPPCFEASLIDLLRDLEVRSTASNVFISSSKQWLTPRLQHMSLDFNRRRACPLACDIIALQTDAWKVILAKSSATQEVAWTPLKGSLEKNSTCIPDAKSSSRLSCLAQMSRQGRIPCQTGYGFWGAALWFAAPGSSAPAAHWAVALSLRGWETPSRGLPAVSSAAVSVDTPREPLQGILQIEGTSTCHSV